MTLVLLDWVLIARFERHSRSAFYDKSEKIYSQIRWTGVTFEKSGARFERHSRTAPGRDRRCCMSASASVRRYDETRTRHVRRSHFVPSRNGVQGEAVSEMGVGLSQSRDRPRLQIGPSCGGQEPPW
jgi:hypothetical protein